MNIEDYINFASSSMFKTAMSTGTNSSTLSESRIKSMISSPSTSGKTLALASKGIKNQNGAYKRIIKYMSSILNYNHYIYPVFDNVVEAIKSKDDINIDFAQKSVLLERYKLKYYLPIFTEKLFTMGAVFLYKLEDKSSIAFQELSIDYCRISNQTDGVFRYQIDIAKLSADSVLYYPKEIQNAYMKYSNGTYKNDSKFTDTWYQVTDKGFAFSLDVDVLNQLGFSIPPFASVILDAIKSEKAKENMEDKDAIDNAVIVHSRVPLDKNGVPSVEFDIVEKYQNQLKKNLPKGSTAITNPFDTTSISLRGTGQTAEFTLLNESMKQIYKSSGVSQMLFSDDTSSSQALERSIETDIQWLYSFVLPLFENFYNYELLKGSKGSVATWRIKFLNNSHFTKKDDIANAKEQLSFGGSRMEYLASTGMSPIEVANLLVFEKDILMIDELMVVKQNSNTLSSNDTEKGRPSEDNVTDTTTRIKDSE